MRFLCWILNTCRLNQRCRNSCFVCSRGTQHAQADACNPDIWFSKIGTRTSWGAATGSEPAYRSEPTLSPRRARFGGRRLLFSNRCRTSGTLSRPRGLPSAWERYGSPKNRRGHLGVNRDAVRIPACLPPPAARRALAWGLASFGAGASRGCGFCSPHDPRTR